MTRRIDWVAKQAYARGLPTVWLRYALNDVESCIRIWQGQRDIDHDGNASYYSDEASVYRAELARRKA